MKRFFLSTPKPAAAAGTKGVRALESRDWPEIGELDLQAFGADRMCVLKGLESRLSQAALVCERAGRVAGFLLGRDGREASQLGPLVALDAQAASALLAAGLAAVQPPVYLDLVDREAELSAWLGKSGFAFQRPFTRMVHGTQRAPGNASLVYCPAGPELG